MRQVALGMGLRVLLGVIGAAAVIAGVVIGIAEVWKAMHLTFWPSAVGALICVVVICGGALLLQGAWRGRIAVRDPAGRASRQRR
jgi:hypothetical protein